MLGNQGEQHSVRTCEHSINAKTVRVILSQAPVQLQDRMRLILAVDVDAEGEAEPNMILTLLL